MRRREFTLAEDQERRDASCAHDPRCHSRPLQDLWKERRLDTQRVFLYKGSLEESPNRLCCGLSQGRDYGLDGCMTSAYGQYEFEAGRG